MTSLEPEPVVELYEEKVLLGGMLDLKLDSKFADSKTTLDMINCVRKQFIENCDVAIVLKPEWNVDSVDYFGSHIVSDFNLRLQYGDENLESWIRHNDTLKYALEHKKIDYGDDSYNIAVKFGNQELANEIYRKYNYVDIEMFEVVNGQIVMTTVRMS